MEEDRISSLRVKTLDGRHTVHVPLAEVETVHELKKYLKRLHSRFDGCKLLCSGKQLQSSDKLNEGFAGRFVTACLKRKSTTTGASTDRRENEAQNLDGIGAEQSLLSAEESHRKRRKEESLDTLLPGYLLRPHASPIKGRTTTSPVVVPADETGCEDAVSDDGPCHMVSNEDLAQITLSESMYLLEKTYDDLWALHQFLSSTRSPCTCKTVRSLLGGSIAYIDALARLAPCVLSYHHISGCVNLCARWPALSACDDECMVDLPDPWKTKSENIPLKFKDQVVNRLAESWSDSNRKNVRSQKRIRQCWMLRKCLVNLFLEMDGHRLKYDKEGLISQKHFGSPETLCAGTRSDLSLEEILVNIKDKENATSDNFSLVKGKMAGVSNAPPLLLRKTPPCTCSQLFSTPEDLISHLESLIYYRGQIVSKKVFPARNANAVHVKYASFSLSPEMMKYLDESGFSQIFNHQQLAIQSLVQDRTSCVVSTSTASGKSLCYLIPIFESMIRMQKEDNSSSRVEPCALLIFPTKALTQDQLQKIRRMGTAILGNGFANRIHIYDGDTPLDVRDEIRSKSRILLTNPDMLHTSILPHHQSFGAFFRNLEYVVVDEAHMYRGIFGSHVALVMRRLKRICSIYNSALIFILTTATLANPEEHAQTLIGESKFNIVSSEDDGSPCLKKTFLLWNPPLMEKGRSDGLAAKSLVEEGRRQSLRHARQERKFPMLLGKSIENDKRWEKGVAIGQPEYKMKSKLAQEALMALSAATANGYTIDKDDQRKNWRLKIQQISKHQALLREKRTSPIVEISFLLAECVKHGFCTIAFCKTRKLSELVATYTRELLGATSPELVDLISVYRAGYSDASRRDIERRLFSGELKGIACTNALELGIDIGGLDVTLHLGFPGTVASLWQQAGRSGRRNKESLSVYVAFDGPLDQMFMSNPSSLFDRNIEAAHIDLSNKSVLKSHLMCAAFECPLKSSSDISLFGGEDIALEPIKSLVHSRTLSPAGNGHAGMLVYSGAASYPAKQITLRDIDKEKYVVIEEGANGAVLEEIEACKVSFVVYDGAIYQHQGRTYIVKSIDYRSKVATVRQTDVKYFTTTIDYTDVHLLGDKLMCTTDNHARGTSRATCNECTVTTRWMGYARIWRGSGKVFDSVDLFVPDVVYDTVACSQRLPRVARAFVQEKGIEFRDSVHAAAHAIMNIVPLFLMCNPEDIGTECDNQYDTRYKPERLLIFDKYPGGNGISSKIQPIFDQLIKEALKLVTSCQCEDGCTGCILSTVCSEYNACLSKQGAQIILQNALHSTE